MYNKGIWMRMVSTLDSEARRNYIMKRLRTSAKAVTGTALAKECDVSRQIIVGDVAILRAQGADVISTPRGYQLVASHKNDIQHVFVCCHGWEKMEEELLAIVDNGGVVRNVCVEHEVYGTLEAALNLHSRRDVFQYMEHMKKANAELLSCISGGIHTHLVEAATAEDIQAIRSALQKIKVIYE